jgi:hypothetical protein
VFGMTRVVLLSGLLLTFGCSSEDEPERTRAEFCEDWAEAACSEETVSRCQAADSAACKLSQTSFCLDLVPEGFEDTTGDACLRAVRSAYADGDLSAAELRTVLRLDAPCDRLVRGPAGEGETCDSDQDCATPDGFVCVLKGGATAGTCQQPDEVQPGTSCAAAQQVCSEGFYCNGANCIAHLAAGAACTSNEECGPAARCLAGTCDARLTVRASCTSDDECISGVCFQFDDGQRCTDRLPLSPSEPICDDLS